MERKEKNIPNKKEKEKFIVTGEINGGVWVDLNLYHLPTNKCT